ncbi:putative bifunctional diguanylate cyclase/phosphodiesterase [Cohnella endophytica]|uniref:putative bifunctional diguanylate cyclase/phosphodiesterase n=1 Tax=Cohnella endophytica TaxID=2419778 RepID=UPI0011C39B87|nr:EAL domain-containing protein [Cohnella endophytica]
MESITDLESRLWKAWENQEFTMNYQPQVNILTGSIEKFEALIRWNCDGIPISPETFIPIAEETGLIVPLGMWVLQTVCEQLKKWETECPDFCGVSVNFSARQFQEPEIVQTIIRAVEASGVSPRRVEIELTEGTFMLHQGNAVEIFEQLKQTGITVAIDDFGTGFSSLSYLQHIPFDTLKLDRSFIMNLQHDVKSQAIVKAIIALARSLNVRVVAEGVEYEQQLEFLKLECCDAVQGFLFSKPVSAEEAYQLFVHHKLSKEAVKINEIALP